ncbi:hypothetical protein [Oceanobacter mangrovi]|uniref:hypothetical protein n=1 Tax=Oceanobacter mangrovi TaxID=2862510 RepID=UPI001C8E2A63|nr:hypothetical protein [Oceanobacter mangrovi]
MIKSDDILAMCELADEMGLSEQLISKLREIYPGKGLTWCSEDDINHGKPYLERDKYLVYLVDSRDHCSILTNDEEIATGVVFAELYED